MCPNGLDKAKWEAEMVICLEHIENIHSFLLGNLFGYDFHTHIQVKWREAFNHINSISVRTLWLQVTDMQVKLEYAQKKSLLENIIKFHKERCGTHLRDDRCRY